jgi:hypothetical protein
MSVKPRLAFVLCELNLSGTATVALGTKQRECRVEADNLL